MFLVGMKMKIKIWFCVIEQTRLAWEHGYDTWFFIKHHTVSCFYNWVLLLSYVPSKVRYIIARISDTGR